MVAIIHDCPIPVTGGAVPLQVSIEAGRSIIIIGANGAGKTRLGVHIENELGEAAHRIAAQKSLTLNDEVQLISLERAEKTLRFGTPDGSNQTHKRNIRWGNSPATHPLNDFDALLQTLFAEHNRIASEHLKQRKTDPHTPDAEGQRSHDPPDGVRSGDGEYQPGRALRRLQAATESFHHQRRPCWSAEPVRQQGVARACSLAHDNSLLNHEEAMLIFNHVTSALRFLRDLEQRVQRREKAAADKAAQAAASDDDIPF